jgi:CheY-like chemotaxis protein
MVALTADMNDRIVKQSKMAGMAHVLSKPLQKSLLATFLP